MAMVTADLSERFPGRIVVIAPPRCRDVLAGIPGSGYRRISASDGVWSLPFTWAAYTQLQGDFGSELGMSEELRAALDELYTHELACYRDQELAQFVAPPDAPPEFGQGSPKLLEYQGLAVDWLMTRGSGAVLDEMGVGKTATGCMSARRWVEARASEDGQPSRALIVCPKTKRLDWLEELGMWWPEGHHAALNGTPAKRRKTIAAWAAEARSGALVASWEDIKAHSRLASYGNTKLADSEKVEKELNGIEWTAVIADEAHRGLNPNAKQTRALWWLGDHARHRLALTGTPVANTVTDMWSVLRYVAPEEWSGRSKFTDRYVRLSWNFWGGSTVEGLKDDHAQEYRALSERWWVRRTKEQVLPWLPKRKVTRRWVELPPKHRKAYNAFAEEMVVDLDSGGQLMSFSAMTQAARLAQMACAPLEIDEDGDVRMVEPSPKVDALLELWEDRNREPMAVLSASRQLIDLVSSRLDKEEIPHVAVVGGMKSIAVQEAKAMYNSGEVDIILISLGAGAEGLSLSRGSLEVVLDRSMSAPKNAQGYDRMHGLGRGDHGAEFLEIVEILTTDTVDQARLELIENKGLQAEEVLRDKEMLKEVLRFGTRR